MGKDFADKLKSLRREGGLGSFSFLPEGKPEENVKHFQGEHGLKKFSSVGSSFILSYNAEKAPVGMRIPFRLRDCENTAFMLTPQLATSEKGKLGLKLSAALERAVEAARLLCKRKVIEEVGFSSFRRPSAPNLDQRIEKKRGV